MKELVELLQGIDTDYETKEIGMSVYDVIGNAYSNSILVSSKPIGFTDRGLNVILLETDTKRQFDIYIVANDSLDPIERQYNAETISKKVIVELINNGYNDLTHYEVFEVENAKQTLMTVFVVSGTVEDSLC
jgi:hypothetical protein